ncbi:hypothetical protein [Thalassotalea piscium]|uniref:Uncharacterized protein n=1 Tax=Thalassotalea piscium TaxID=1230533 RepID=A0A7X0TT98_9GAMM|nr:hypothetical protein [Thalassotalea piscium]MBB6542865.1 hypothetical protein [Thalassotalea piscium]
MFKESIKRFFKMSTNVAVGGYWHSISVPQNLESLTFPLKDITEIRMVLNGHDLFPVKTVDEIKDFTEMVPWQDLIIINKKSATIKLHRLSDTCHKELMLYCEKQGCITFFCLTK